MTQQNETEQQSAAEPGERDQLTPGTQERTGTKQQAAATGQPGGSPPTGMPPQPAIAAPAPSAPAPAAPAPADPAVPPPLYGYESVPAAYLAPPQPGQPRYGTPRNRGSGRPFAGTPGYGEPGAGQRAGGQPGYGRPGPARPGAGGAGRRDPALALAWQRFAAQAIDWFIIIVVSVIAFWSQLSMAFREVQAITGRYPDFTSQATQTAVNNIYRNTSIQHTVLYWYLVMFGVALAYFWVQHAAWGVTVGKRAMGVRVVGAADRTRAGVVAAGVRTVVFLAGPAIFLLLAPPLSLVGGVLWVADIGLPVLDLRAQALHDKLAGTIVVRQSALVEQARRSRSQ